MTGLARRVYYFFRPLIPRTVQIGLRRMVARRQRKHFEAVWPIDQDAGKPPAGWRGWPDGKRFALVLTHDVDTARGHENCIKLMELEERLGFRSSFNFVPERYAVSPEIRHRLTEKGFEVGVHGLLHDGKLYSSRKVFLERTIRINHYLREWKAVGFRSPAMHHNLDWIHDLDIEYDASCFDTDPFEPQSDGVRTIFPFYLEGQSGQYGYVELPYTLPQDSTLFVLLKEQNISVWRQKLDWISQKGGMALLNTHPDYMNFEEKDLRVDEYPARYYQEFLVHVEASYHDLYWHPLPRDMTRYWRAGRTHSDG